MIEYVKYHPDHLLSMDGRLLITDEPVSREIAEYHSYFPATTVVCDEEVVACFGMNYLWSGVAEAWVAFRDDVPDRFPKSLAVGTRVALDTMANMVDRLQAVVDVNKDNAIRFVEHYGFEREGILKKYRHNRDYVMYARVS